MQPAGAPQNLAGTPYFNFHVKRAALNDELGLWCA